MVKIITFVPEFNPNQKPKMKKVLSMILFAGMLSMTACGPSAEEKAAQEKQKQDSIAAADAAKKAAEEAAKQDSIAKAKHKEDSIKGMKGGSNSGGGVTPGGTTPKGADPKAPATPPKNLKDAMTKPK